MLQTVLIFGLGYTGKHFAKAFLNQGSLVIGTKQKQLATTEKTTLPIVHAFNNQESLDPSLLEEAEVILSTIPPAIDGTDPVLTKHAHDLKKLKHLRWIGYLSATSVYGDTKGVEAHESFPLNPGTALGKARKVAENQWRQLSEESGLPLHIFRLGGIYGPERSIFDRLQSPDFQNYYDEKHLFHRIHVDDIVSILMKSIENPSQGEIFNVVDDNPSPFHETAEYAANLLGCTTPKRILLDEAQMSPMMRDFFSENRLISNQKIKKNLGITLKYPSFREGLQSILNAKKSVLL